MAIQIVIQGTPINFPESADSPDWAPAVDQFAVLVANALSAAVGPFDISPQILNIDGDNPGSGVIPNLSFPTSEVRSANIKYSVFRKTNTTTAYESGFLNVVYSPDNSTGLKWEITRDYEGEGSISFTISDVGQVSFATSTISGSGHTGVLSYSAQCLLQS